MHQKYSTVQMDIFLVVLPTSMYFQVQVKVCVQMDVFVMLFPGNMYSKYVLAVNNIAKTSIWML